MKNLLCIFLVVFFSIVGCAFQKAWSDNLLTRDQAITILIEQVINPSPNKDLLMTLGPQNMLAVGDIVEPSQLGGEIYPGNSRTVNSPTWFFWIDDELPSLNNISSIAIYKLQFGSTTPPQEQADYNITDQDLIAQIYSGLTKKTQLLIDRHQFLAEGIIYLKMNDNSFKELIVINDWKYLYVSSEGPSNSIFYEISSDVKTLLIENTH